jgi:3,4-dihydroxy 2-butanone 4-phosphate synthase/GTP cyclohydrolase II
MAKFGRGLICLTLTEARCRQLDLPLMVRDNKAPHGTAFTVSIEAAEGVTTGISAAGSLAITVQAAVAKNAKPDRHRPARPHLPADGANGGVLVRAGHTEAGCDLVAHGRPGAGLGDLRNPQGRRHHGAPAGPAGVRQEHGSRSAPSADLIHYRAANERLVEREGERDITTPFGAFKLVVYPRQDQPRHASGADQGRHPRRQ